jgi:hypothetical protein
MTELFIDRQPVVLPKDFSLEIVAEVPFLVKNGTSTLELSNPENAKIYRYSGQCV